MKRITFIPAEKIRASCRFIRSQTRYRPLIGIILGSGLGEFVNEMECNRSISTRNIPQYPALTISGHPGYLHFGKIGNAPVAVFQGRIHFYETGSLQDTLFPILIAKKLGVKLLIITNAAGGINRSFRPGDLMLIKDHINFTFRALPQEIPDLYRHRNYYDPDLRRLARAVADDEHISLREGVYCAVSGPSYETGAEVEMLRIIGADSVGMSTVIETACANNLGIRVLGISCITNLASGAGSDKLSHEGVTSAAAAAQVTLNMLLKKVIIAMRVSRII